MFVTDILPQKVLGSNRQVYKQLKLALKLGLRRQIFVAVCDDLRLRNLLAARLEADLAESSSEGGREAGAAGSQRLVRLDLNLNEPNPLAQIRQWFAEHPSSGSRAIFPNFQLLGVENLTRAAPAVQWFFLNGLREIERSLPTLEFSLLFWVPKPWCNSIQQSAPEFWRSRTGVFEFKGEPTPVNGTSDSLSLRKQRRVIPMDRVVSNDENTPVAKEAMLAADLPPSSTSEQVDVEETTRGDNSQVEDSDESRVSVPSITNTQDSQWLKPPKEVRTQEKPYLVEPAGFRQVDSKLVKLVEAAAKLPAEGELHARQPLEILQYIEQLHQQGAAAADLATAYLKLGNFYRDALKGDRAGSGSEQLESASQYLTIASAAYEQVLQLLNDEGPIWADLSNDLGNFYWMLSRYGSSSQDKISYLQRAVSSYQRGSSKVNPQTRSQAWAMIQNNLGAVYSELARYQDSAENLQESVLAYTEALRIRKADLEAKKSGAERPYASTQNNLGTAYWNLAQHNEPLTNLRQAIAAYTEALRYYTPDRQPLDYGMIQNNLGTAYWNLAQYAEAKDNLLLAIGAYQIALMYRTPELVPAACAATQNNLGTAYWHLANQTKAQPAARAEFLKQAIAAYEAAIAIADQIAEAQGHSPAPLNFDIFATHNNLGLAHYQLLAEKHFPTDPASRSRHLETALHHHLQACTGWKQQPEFYKTALSYVVQTIRAFYSECGIQGQNLALSKVPGHLLPEIMRRL